MNATEIKARYTSTSTGEYNSVDLLLDLCDCVTELQAPQESYKVAAEWRNRCRVAESVVERVKEELAETKLLQVLEVERLNAIHAADMDELKTRHETIDRLSKENNKRCIHEKNLQDQLDKTIKWNADTQVLQDRIKDLQDKYDAATKACSNAVDTMSTEKAHDAKEIKRLREMLHVVYKRLFGYTDTLDKYGCPSCQAKRLLRVELYPQIYPQEVKHDSEIERLTKECKRLNDMLVPRTNKVAGGEGGDELG